MDDLSQQHVGNAAALNAEFDAARPFRHLTLHDFLEPALVADLQAQFPAFAKEKALNEFGDIGGKAVHQNLPELGSAYARFDRLVRSSEFLGWLSVVTGIPKLLYDAEYVGGGTHENVDGQELDPHVDFNYHPNRTWHRRLNLILFLNNEWDPGWGGCLELHSNPWIAGSGDEVRTVVPGANRAVVFETTESSWHGFRRIALPAAKRGLSRKTIAAYFYTLERPAEQTAPGHGTYYVPRPLPERFAAGATLSTDDVAELRNLIDRRNQQIRFLWEREREMNEYLEKLHRSPSVRLGRALTWPLRGLRDALKR